MATSINTGAEAIKAVYQRTLEVKQVDFICLSNQYEAVVGDWFEVEYSPKLYDGVRVTREIVPNTQENREYGRQKPDTSRVKYVDGYRSQTDVIVTNEWVALVSFNPDLPEVTVFDDPEVVATFKLMFEWSWKQAQ
jgi:hypothetical protein